MARTIQMLTLDDPLPKKLRRRHLVFGIVTESDQAAQQRANPHLIDHLKAHYVVMSKVFRLNSTALCLKNSVLVKNCQFPLNEDNLEQRF